MKGNNNPLISICILNRNGEERLPKAIPSILSQEYSNIEFIFLDNGSTDKSVEYISQFKEIKIIKNKTNLGISGGRNKLAKFTKGEYILFIDNDVELITRNFLSQILKDYIYLKDKNIGVLFPIVRLEGQGTDCEVGLYYNKLQNVKFKDVYKKGYIQKPGFLGGIFLIEKNIFFDLGCFDEKYIYNMDDHDFSMRLYNMGYTIFVDTNLYVIHHGLEMRTTAKGVGLRYQYYFCGLIRSVLKNYTLKNVIFYSPMILCWSFTKACKYSIKYKSILPLKGFFTSVKSFFKDLPDTLSLRKKYQKQRIIKKDLFLKIK